MKVSLLKGCTTPEEKEQRKKSLKACMFGFDILTQVLEEELKEAQVSRPGDYSSPSWAYHQADLNGRIRTLNKYIKLLKDLKND